ncbi:low molecular weight protein arginine phosphatase [Paenibacillus lutimineralis]|uniref:Low molecular weight protein arginine phosphatase n=1 Tax=Paenibacillus lutimineralis TaxID=2707005 RepID=A0A3Q9ICC5_9BACL|nr:low molecular weight protein arginine phosphatase [Paenibacillus lutimineralis]AZS17659.1 low molecular weight protein arginine phosphatase [Paenibacillus lutimineralis]
MRILFICTGNTCRSPMAEGMLRKLAKDRGMSLDVRSAGVAASEGTSMSAHAAAVLRDQGIEDRITSTPLSEGLVDWADLILTLTGGHRRHVIQYFPVAADKIYTLKEYVENDLQVLEAQDELHQLVAELELDRALGKELDTARQRRLAELLRQMPAYDISDPFGGSRMEYNATALEIRSALEQLLDKLEKTDFKNSGEA